MLGFAVGISAWVWWPQGDKLSASDIASIEGALSELDEKVEGKLRCERPTLRGVPTKGADPAAVYALLDGDGVLADCFDALGSDAIAQEPLVVGDEPAPIEREGPATEAARLRCQHAVPLLRKEIAHQSGCRPSPLSGPMRSALLPPHEVSSMFSLRIVRLGSLAIIEARHLARQGDRLAAAQLLLDAALFAQDLGRGRATLLNATVSAAVLEKLLLHLAAIALEPGRLSDEERALVRAELGVLIDSTPGPDEVAPYEALVMARVFLSQNGSESFEGAAAALASAKLGMKLCTLGDSYADCISSLQNFSATTALPAGVLTISDSVLRDRIETSARGNAKSLPKYLRKIADVKARMIALESALSLGAEGGCSPAFDSRNLGFEPAVVQDADVVRIMAPWPSSATEPTELLRFACADG